MAAGNAVVSRYLSSSSKSGFCQSPVESPTQEQSCPKLDKSKYLSSSSNWAWDLNPQGPGPILFGRGQDTQGEDIGEKVVSRCMKA